MVVGYFFGFHFVALGENFKAKHGRGFVGGNYS